MKIYIINGYPESGKDSFCNFCTEILWARFIPYCVISTVDWVKEILYKTGWNGEKTPKYRNLMAKIKDSLSDLNISKLIIEHSIQVGNPSSIYFIHCREPQEIKYYEEKFDAKSIFIKRKNNALHHADGIDNPADLNVENHNYHFTIDNDGTLEELRHKAYYFLASEEII